MIFLEIERIICTPLLASFHAVLAVLYVDWMSLIAIVGPGMKPAELTCERDAESAAVDRERRGLQQRGMAHLESHAGRERRSKMDADKLEFDLT